MLGDATILRTPPAFTGGSRTYILKVDFHVNSVDTAFEAFWNLYAALFPGTSLLHMGYETQQLVSVEHIGRDASNPWAGVDNARLDALLAMEKWMKDGTLPRGL